MTLTKIQRQERAKRERNRLNMMGLRQPPGTPPQQYRPAERATWKPMPHTMPGWDFGSWLQGLNRLLRARWRLPPGERPPEGS
jgi:hypothetical protein